jgi:cyclophilin family peptidyl-prolyl cis-trans isomerase
MSTAKRKRQKEGRRIRQEAISEARQRAKVRRRLTTISVLLAVGIVLLLVFKHDNKSKTAAPVKFDASCPKADGSSPRKTSFTKAPPTCTDPSKKYTADLVTDAGTIQIALDPAAAPKTVNNFVYLSRYHFYDGLTFHRVIKDFMMQGGDPQGTGSGGPGYPFADELPSSATAYKAGSVAMANSGPNTNGSQFFIVFSQAGASKLQASYSLFGQVSSGQDVMKKIEADGADADPTPPAVVHKIKTVTIKES